MNGTPVGIVSQRNVCIFIDDFELCVILGVADAGMVKLVVNFEGHTVPWIKGVVGIFVMLDWEIGDGVVVYDDRNTEN